MSDITLDAIKTIVNKTIDQFQEAVLLLKQVYEGTAAQQEIGGFLNRIGVVTDEENEKLRNHEAAYAVGHALSMLQADTPLPGIHERAWASPARTFLGMVLADMPLEYFLTIVNDRKNEMWLVSQAIKQWQAWAAQGFAGRQGPTHKDRPVLIEIVGSLLKELRK